MVSAKANEAKDKAEAFKAQRAQRHDRCFTLLVIDDQNTDWSKVRSSFSFTVLHYMSQYYFCWDSVGMDILDLESVGMDPNCRAVS